MLVLALDTCDMNGSIAVLRDGMVVEAIAHTGGEEYSSWLLPSVDRALAAASANLLDIELLAVATGPGSFTGVRIGLTTVKAWGEVFRKPIAGMSRLEALGSQNSVGDGFVAAVLDAQRGQIFAALYERNGNDLTVVGEESVITATDFLTYVKREAAHGTMSWVSTDSRLLETELLWPERAALGETILTVSPTLAPLIGKLGMHKALRGQLSDSLSLDANYVRRSYVETGSKTAPRAGT
jgi:tRNA threonylcarbamoyladenosine biosynthesis protein TsaB